MGSLDSYLSKLTRDLRLLPNSTVQISSTLVRASSQSEVDLASLVKRLSIVFFFMNA